MTRYYKYLNEHKTIEDSYFVVHNHNTESPLSAPDFQEMCTWKNVCGYCAVTNNGITFTVIHNGKSFKHGIYGYYEDMVAEMRRNGKMENEVERRIVERAIEDFCKGGLYVNDGRAKNDQ